MTTTLFSFLFAITILTLTPGFDTALVLRSAVAQGAKRASVTALGITLGCLVWGVAVGFGLGALLLASEMAYNLLKWLGAAWLLYLGLKLLLKPRQAAIDSQQPALQQGYLACFSRGLLGNLLNPKVGIFYVSFLPQFIPAGASVALWCSLMALAHMLLGLIWNAVLIGGSHYFAGHLRKPRVLKVMDRLTGCVFIGFAAKLALSRR
ncbi:threonine/homoserine/homoserine lactone efflux protein [Pantoea agglomerans]|jgi:threonine/homoserine/homoserine lactone efflux protein|uniref:Leucine efflux protein n=1 Tax=Enterobacter agglomerans TaxID=549 RepID=A0A379AFP1_ENTAG|nr:MULTISPECIES: LysE family translocator [Pantoea]MDF9910861.1 threonine/homoserine/homoserine lactone efflux protein [Pantoea brenneri]AYP22941.1 LysE family translocator [Pantoea agglomerans]KAF6635205.1 LysE family translocator [Pantoea sp. EKM10T]KAF6685055.1 LysE family translocator [Pantoea sp. EKM20T]KDA93331.1 lysine transporter LysE [Pantoea agglomerans Eh318]